MFKYTYRCTHVQIHAQMHSCLNTHTDALMFKYPCIHVQIHIQQELSPASAPTQEELAQAERGTRSKFYKTRLCKKWDIRQLVPALLCCLLCVFQERKRHNSCSTEFFFFEVCSGLVVQWGLHWPGCVVRAALAWSCSETQLPRCAQPAWKCWWSGYHCP